MKHKSSTQFRYWLWIFGLLSIIDASVGMATPPNKTSNSSVTTPKPPVDLSAAAQVLPSLLQSPEVAKVANNLIGGQVLSSLGRSYVDAGLPGSQLLQGSLPPPTPDPSAAAAAAAQAAAASSSDTSSAQALNDFAKPLSRLVSGYQLAPSDVSQLINSFPQLVEAGAVQKFDASQMSPDLLRHILRGGQIPGVPKQVLDNIVASQMKNIAKAAALANQGISNDFTKKTLPPLEALPNEFIQKVAAGELLPGLTANETSTVKDYYLKLLAAKAPPTPTANITNSSDGQTQLGPGIIVGVSAADLMKRLPPGFDLTRLPPSLIAAVAAGQPFDLTQMPPDMLAAFRDFNPDLKEQIDEALNRPKLTNAPTIAPPTVKRPVIPWSELSSPYDISEVDRQTDLKLKSDEKQKTIMMWTGVGLAFVALVSVALLGYMCYRRKQMLKKGVGGGGFDDSLVQNYKIGGNNKPDVNIDVDGDNNAISNNNGHHQQHRRGVPAFGPILPTTYMNGHAGSNMVSPTTTYVVPPASRKISPLTRLPLGAIMEPIEEVSSPPLETPTNKNNVMNGGNNTSVVSVAAEYEQFRHDLQKNMVKTSKPVILVTSASTAQLKSSASQSTPIASNVATVPTAMMTTHMSGIVYDSRPL